MSANDELRARIRATKAFQDEVAFWQGAKLISPDLRWVGEGRGYLHGLHQGEGRGHIQSEKLVIEYSAIEQMVVHAEMNVVDQSGLTGRRLFWHWRPLRDIFCDYDNEAYRCIVDELGIGEPGEHGVTTDSAAARAIHAELGEATQPYIDRLGAQLRKSILSKKQQYLDLATTFCSLAEA